MPKQSDLEEYAQQVYKIWIVSCFARTFARDLMNAMLEAGFLIDNVVASLSDADAIIWRGTCVDADLSVYAFVATWTLNMQKFTASDVHYYDLTDVCIGE